MEISHAGHLRVEFSGGAFSSSMLNDPEREGGGGNLSARLGEKLSSSGSYLTWRRNVRERALITAPVVCFESDLSFS